MSAVLARIPSLNWQKRQRHHLETGRQVVQLAVSKAAGCPLVAMVPTIWANSLDERKAAIHRGLPWTSELLAPAEAPDLFALYAFSSVMAVFAEEHRPSRSERSMG